MSAAGPSPADPRSGGCRSRGGAVVAVGWRRPVAAGAGRVALLALYGAPVAGVAGCGQYGGCHSGDTGGRSGRVMAVVVVEIVALVVLVAGTVVVFAEAFSAYRAGGALERRLAALEEGQQQLLAVLREQAVPAAPDPPRTSIVLLRLRIPGTGRPQHVEVTQWTYAAPRHADRPRLRAVTADYLTSGEVDPGWPSVTARWAAADARGEDLGAAVHRALLGRPVAEVDRVTGVPADLPTALAMVPPVPGEAAVPVARVAALTEGVGTADPVLVTASFKSLVRSDLTDVIGRAIGDGLFADRVAPPPVPAPAPAPVGAWPFAEDDARQPDAR